MAEQISRKIIISQHINDNLAGEVVAQILEINEMDKHMSSWDKYKAEPIEIYINSNGGSATAGFAIIGAMEMSETPIITYGMGIIASMALAIFIAGDERIAHRFARFMYHSVAYGADGHIQDHADGLVEGRLMQEMYDSLFLDRTKFTKELMSGILKEKSNFFFSAKKALKLGVADDIILRPEISEETPITEEEYNFIMEELQKQKQTKTTK